MKKYRTTKANTLPEALGLSKEREALLRDQVIQLLITEILQGRGQPADFLVALLNTEITHSEIELVFVCFMIGQMVADGTLGEALVKVEAAKAHPIHQVIPIDHETPLGRLIIQLLEENKRKTELLHQRDSEEIELTKRVREKLEKKERIIN